MSVQPFHCLVVVYCSILYACPTCQILSMNHPHRQNELGVWARTLCFQHIYNSTYCHSSPLFSSSSRLPILSCLVSSHLYLSTPCRVLRANSFFQKLHFFEQVTFFFHYMLFSVESNMSQFSWNPIFGDFLCCPLLILPFPAAWVDVSILYGSAATCSMMAHDRIESPSASCTNTIHQPTVVAFFQMITTLVFDSCSPCSNDFYAYLQLFSIFEWSAAAINRNRIDYLKIRVLSGDKMFSVHILFLFFLPPYAVDLPLTHYGFVMSASAPNFPSLYFAFFCFIFSPSNFFASFKFNSCCLPLLLECIPLSSLLLSSSPAVFCRSRCHQLAFSP